MCKEFRLEKENGAATERSARVVRFTKMRFDPSSAAVLVPALCAETRSLLAARRLDAGRQQGLDELGVGAVVKTDDALFAARGDDGAVGADADGVEKIVIPAEIARIAAVVHIPKAHGGVAAARGELAGGADEQQPGDLLAVSGDSAGLLAFFVIPHLYRVVRSSAGQKLAVGLPTHIH